MRATLVATICGLALAGCSGGAEPAPEPGPKAQEPLALDDDRRPPPPPKRSALQGDERAQTEAVEVQRRNAEALEPHRTAEEDRHQVLAARRRAEEEARRRGAVALDEALTGEADRRARALEEVRRTARERNDEGVACYLERAAGTGGPGSPEEEARRGVAQTRRRADALAQLVMEAKRQAARTERLARSARRGRVPSRRADRDAVRAAAEVTELEVLRARATAEARWALEALRRIRAGTPARRR